MTGTQRPLWGPVSMVEVRSEFPRFVRQGQQPRKTGEMGPTEEDDPARDGGNFSRTKEPAVLPDGPVFGLLLLNWNDHINVVNCAESLLRSVHAPARLYVVDNGSRPESTGYIRAHLGSAILVENRRNLGGFDERLFFGGEDHEMALRILRAGMRIRYVPTAKVWHKGGFTGGGAGTPLMAFFGIRNYLLVARWYGSAIQKIAAWGMTVAVRIPRILLQAVLKRNTLYLKGLKWSLTWFVNPRLVPSDAEVAEALVGPGRRASRLAGS